ncbi:MAG: porin family protein [Sphingobacteriales bacterium]|nr:MAG: porin family protein [Sphingobacteriales bacterium]
MKKLFIALLAMASFTAANAQQKGSWLTYGDITFATSKDKIGSSSAISNTNTTFGINPGVGYQFSHHSTIGVQGGFNIDRNVSSFNLGIINLELETRTTSWGAGAFYRYTQPMGNIFFLYTQVNAGFMSSKLTTPDTTGTTVGDFETKMNGFGATVFPGIGVNVCKGFALNFATGGIAFSTTWGDQPKAFNPHNTSFGLTFGRQINIGVSRNIGCGHKKHGHMEPGMEMRKHKKEKDDEGDDE